MPKLVRVAGEVGVTAFEYHLVGGAGAEGRMLVCELARAQPVHFAGGGGHEVQAALDRRPAHVVVEGDPDRRRRRDIFCPALRCVINDLRRAGPAGCELDRDEQRDANRPEPVSRPRNSLPVAVPCGQGNFRLRRKLIPWCGRSALLPAPLLTYVFPIRTLRCSPAPSSSTTPGAIRQSISGPGHYEPPDTATPLLDDGVTPVDDD